MRVLRWNKILLRDEYVVIGAVHTPALLLRSGLKHDLIGRHLCIHPVCGVAGVLPGQSTGLSSGVGMGVAVKYPSVGEERKGSMKILESKNKQLEAEEGWGVIIETPPVHPGLFGLLVPWRDGLSYKLTTMLYPNFEAFIAIARDHSDRNNRIVLSVQVRGFTARYYARIIYEQYVIMTDVLNEIDVIYMIK